MHYTASVAALAAVPDALFVWFVPLGRPAGNSHAAAMRITIDSVSVANGHISVSFSCALTDGRESVPAVWATKGAPDVGAQPDVELTLPGVWCCGAGVADGSL